MTPEEREAMKELVPIWQNLQAQVQQEKERLQERDSKPLKATGAQLQALQEHINLLWEEGGRKKREAEMEIACEVCKGARFVSVRDSNPPRTVACPNCWGEWYCEQIRKRWRLSDKELEIGQKQFVRRANAPQVTEAYLKVKEFGESVIAGTADMMGLTGTVGIGKTHLMLMLHRKVDGANKGVIYRTATHIQRILQNFGYDDESKREADYRRGIAINDLTKAPLLILDEAEKATGEWFENQMLDIINIRRNNRLATALAGNDLYKLPPPVVSRVRAQGCIFMDLSGVADARPVLE